MNMAIGLGIIPWILEILKVVIDADDENIRQGPQVAILAYDIFTAHALLTDANYASTALVAFCYWVFGNGLILALSPSTACSIWGTVENEDKLLSITRSCGYGLLSYGASMYALSKDIEVTKVVGYGLIPWLIDNVNRNYVLKEVEKFGQDAGPQYFWLLFFAVVIISTAL